MQSIHPLPANDPVSRAIFHANRSASRHPVPLVATSYDIHILGGLADVVAKRTFRNSEAQSIEATLTFPLPVHAVLYALEARIGTRTVKAIAKAKGAARETYEDAVDRGKTAVLHEELLKGVHMLSVGHVAPGTEIEVTARFALALSWIGGRALLRIPTTVGDIYGNSGLPDSDELVHGGTVQAADIKVSSGTGTPILLGGMLVNGAARVWLDTPINIEVKDWSACDLIGRAADGNGVHLSIRPGDIAQANLDVAILVDHSGSMGEPCAAGAGVTKHAAVLLGLTEAADDLRESDRLNLWEFDTLARDLGTAHASGWRCLLRSLSGPNGGTEIGLALDAVLMQRPVRDILLVTDGKSHALGVQRFAASGARFTVVLIGHDSLEANVGHLAALSGGEIFVPEGADVTAAVRSALASLRAPRTPNGAVGPGEITVRAHRSGMAVTATWGPATPAPDDASGARAVAAYAANLRMVRLDETAAAKLAEVEGLVTHLTSLILVDEEGAAQAGLPATRKVALPSPATVAAQPGVRLKMSDGPLYAIGTSFSHGRSKSVQCEAKRAVPASNAIHRIIPAPVRSAKEEGPRGPITRHLSDDETRQRAEALETARLQDEATADAGERTPVLSLAHLASLIDWRAEGQRLSEGNMIGLAPGVADQIDAAAHYGMVRRAAKRLGLSPRTFVIGLIARSAAVKNRFADRVARAILAKAKTGDIAPVAEKLGLAVSGKVSA